MMKVVACGIVSLLIGALEIAAPAAVSAVATPAFAAIPSNRPETVSEIGYRAEIRRTSYGVPHILAADVGSVSFGQGWAYAEDRLCDLADQVVKVRGERSRWLGRGPGDRYLSSDIAYRTLGLTDRAGQELPKLSAGARAMLAGYAAGYNRYLRTVGPAAVRGWCAGAQWIGPISPVDLLAYQQDLALVSSGRALLPAIAVAQPPGAGGAKDVHVPPDVVANAARRLVAAKGATAGVGSNGWAIGDERSASGRGALLANPHFPWQGELRLWESQLTVPGVLDVYGAGVGGLPGIQIGFNERVAWTHTVAPGARYTFAELKLAPGDPTSYRVGDRVLRMRAKTVSVPVREPDGGTVVLTRTMWSGAHGPIVDLSSLDPAYGWRTTSAVEYRDANAGNVRQLDFWLAVAKSSSVAEVAALNAKYGTAWLNTVAADRAGATWYGDAASTPDLSPAATAAWLASPIGLLDGSDPGQDWLIEPGAAAPGLLPASRWPRLTRRDYVFNANNSPWIANPRQPIEGFPAQLGEERAALPARARFNAMLLADPGPHRRFGLGDLVSAVLSNETLSSRLLLGPVRDLCREHAGSAGDGWRDVVKACAVLDGWDGRFSVHSRGSVLWRETMAGVLAAYPDALVAPGPLLSSAFDPRDPVHTPGGPKPDPKVLGQALDKARRTLEAAGFPLDVALGAVQHSEKRGRDFPVPGAPDTLGALDVAEYTAEPGTTTEPVVPPGAGGGLTKAGYPVNTGTSMLLAVQFTGRGPVAKGLLTFSESSDPASPHFADQQALFARGAVRDCLFAEPAILADPNLRTAVVSGA
ncbi:penicillin acylase family protein [Amycolatopsis rubida]|uniref:Acyl-homoserine-lactone acylase n=1 Tax=Amycolatopsis rubida TaxID=112413 RepID=A0A1I6AIJ9_9PSEU|nr:penicillin acylase family protein [Amycolatopsis rubida]SFQ68501.1 acyl-homoserine-lactone acylase [Amycolatopsis rubida]